jgi:acyl carrier protein
LQTNEFLSTLDELLELDKGTLKGSEALDSLVEWNSLAVISFMALVDENFGISLPPQQIAACSTVADLVSLVGEQLAVGN